MNRHMFFSLFSFSSFLSFLYSASVRLSEQNFSWLNLIEISSYFNQKTYYGWIVIAWESDWFGFTTYDFSFVEQMKISARCLSVFSMIWTWPLFDIGNICFISMWFVSNMIGFLKYSSLIQFIDHFELSMWFVSNMKLQLNGDGLWLFSIKNYFGWKLIGILEMKISWCIIN
jgi:hypothetical protein